MNEFYKSSVAAAIDPRTIKLNRPEQISMVEFLAEVQEIPIDYEQKQKIIINERTGTVVSGVDIGIKPIIITHGDITIKIKEQAQMSVPKGSVSIDKDLVIGLNENELYTKEGTTTVANVTRSLQKLGATPKDIISILEAMKSAGAIAADLEII